MANRYKVVYGISNGAIPNDLKRTLTLFSRSHHSMTLNISQTATDTVLANITRSPANAGRPRDAVFTYRSADFCFLCRRPCNYHAMFCMDGKRKACQTPRSMYLSIFNSFRVIRCLSQCVSPKIAIFTTFLFPLGTPLPQSR